MNKCQLDYGWHLLPKFDGPGKVKCGGQAAKLPSPIITALMWDYCHWVDVQGPPTNALEGINECNVPMAHSLVSPQALKPLSVLSRVPVPDAENDSALELQVTRVLSTTGAPNPVKAI